MMTLGNKLKFQTSTINNCNKSSNNFFYNHITQTFLLSRGNCLQFWEL